MCGTACEADQSVSDANATVVQEKSENQSQNEVVPKVITDSMISNFAAMDVKQERPDVEISTVTCFPSLDASTSYVLDVFHSSSSSPRIPSPRIPVVTVKKQMAMPPQWGLSLIPRQRRFYHHIEFLHQHLLYFLLEMHLIVQVLLLTLDFSPLLEHNHIPTIYQDLPDFSNNAIQPLQSTTDLHIPVRSLGILVRGSILLDLLARSIRFKVNRCILLQMPKHFYLNARLYTYIPFHRTQLKEH